MFAFGAARKFVVAAALTLAPAGSFAAVFISVGIAPPVLPVYTQPICPGDGYIWTPGYWAYGDEGYYWVPGVWVEPPMVGYLWTPGYWGWGENAYLWHAGYWGPHVGFYGGVNYGFGYVGSGYEGGYWDHGRFAYNRAVNNINIVNVHNVYNREVVVHNTYNRVSYNGGNGGVMARENAQEMAAERERHVQPTTNQMQHQQMASQNRAQFVNVNHGAPAIAAQARVGDRTNVVPAAGVRDTRGGNQVQRQGFGGSPNQGQQQRGLMQGQQNGAAQPMYRDNRNVQPQAAQGQNQYRTQAQPQVQGQNQYRTQAQPQVQGQNQYRTQAQPQVQGQNQYRTQAQPQVQGQNQYRTPPQPQVQNQYRSQPQPQVQAQPRVQPQAPSQPRVQPQPQAQPRGGQAPHQQSAPAAPRGGEGHPPAEHERSK